MTTITIRIKIAADDKYCHHCRWLEACPPGCRLLSHNLYRCLGGGILRCKECLEAEKAVTTEEEKG
jgi:heme oxygenase